MKILIVHNDYGKYSGEEAVVDQYIADDRASGFEVEVMRRTSKFQRDTLWGKIHGFFSGVYSASGVHMMRNAIRVFQPDVVHIHNLYPFISPAVLFPCRQAGIPVVMTVHNYRLLCPNGLFLRDQHPCEECLVSGNEWNCVRHNCEGQISRSFGYALRSVTARTSRAYIDNVTYFCCLTEFQKRKLIEGGFPEEKLLVFPNYIESHIPVTRESEAHAHNKEKQFVGYVGRLSHEKGYDLLLEVARRHPDIPFRFAGLPRDNEPTPALPNVEYCGMLDKVTLSEFYRNAHFIVIPSRCYEGFPLVLLEAYNYGKPCIVPNHAAFPDLLRDGDKLCGRTFQPLSIDDLERQVVEFWNSPDEVCQCGINAASNLKTHYQKDDLTARWARFMRDLASEKDSLK